MKKRRLIKRTLLYGAVLCCTIFFLLPLYWLIISGFKFPKEMFEIPPTLFPRVFTWENFQEILIRRGFSRYFLNSIIVAVSSTAISLLIGSLAAYGLAWYSFKGSRRISLLILTMRMIPPICFIIPFYIIFRKIGLLNTLQGLSVVYIAFQLPFIVWLLEGFFRNLPKEVIESAQIDGCSTIAIFTRIVFPLSAPEISVAAFFAFMLSWNELFMAVILTSSSSQTVPVALTGMVAFFETLWGPLFAGAVVFTVPLLCFGAFLQRYFIKGLLRGAVKG